MEYWKLKLQEYQEALDSEKEMDVVNDDMIRLLKQNIQECLNQIH